ncbi:MAG TPA: TetR/AcrR family transcriptional regulator [Jatrophihabitantaceae bacterium]|nr:TetR/AcrR family transcriptional regulator [Jatrophihabitantaceae bacterium]
MVTKSAERPCARDRLLDAASELFYEEGVHTVGIDRVIERAGVAKATLYSTFGSKDELVRAYLQRRHEATRDRMTRELQRFGTPRERLLGVFEVQAERFGAPDYRGCAFVSASAEAPPGSTIEAASDEFRAWLRGLLTELAQDAGAVDPHALARQLALVYDGAAVGARMDRDPDVAELSRTIATALIDAAIPS